MAESLLITGPPGSGKSRAALDHFRSGIDSLLLTPTATMAEHIRNELARAFSPVRPSRVITLAKFLDRAGAPGAASKPALHLAIEAALDRLRPARFQAVAEYRGFRNAVASLMEEAERDALPRDLARLHDEIERELEARGAALRNARLRAVAQLRGELPSQIVFDGFFAFSNAELNLIESLAARTRIVVTLPGAPDGSGDWPGARATRSRLRLLTAGFVETRCTHVFRTPDMQVFCAPTLEQETEEIARRVLGEVARGRPFRDMGIVLRTRDPYAPALETALARFGIPARFYFAKVLAAHPAIDFLAGVMRALLGGWDHAELLRLVRMPVCGVGATPDGDRFDFELRERLPGRGLPLRGVPEISPAIASLLDAFAAGSVWIHDRLEPTEWVARIRSLRALIPMPVIDGNVSSRQLNAWTSTARSLEAFDALLDEVATLGASVASLGAVAIHENTVADRENTMKITVAVRETTAALRGSGRIALSQFWPRVEAALELAELRLPDRRRDVVHVFDVFEARQWELPVVFVCGMNERHFPQYHREDPLFDDAARRRAGLKTSADLQREERSLYQLSTTRATGQTILSYSRFDEKGDATLPSFFLADMTVEPCGVRVRPRPSRDVPGLANALVRSPIRNADLLRRLNNAHCVLSPSSIESFLQCPFQFFGRKTLRLRKRPVPPRDRLDALAQGGILHSALAALEQMPLLGTAVFDRVFAEECQRRRIPATYRTEAVRLELARNFAAFVEAHGLGGLAGSGLVGSERGWTTRVEEKFSIALTKALSIRGRIDRLEIGPHGEALVIDYKYSAGSKIRERVDDQENGGVVQGGLYLLAAARAFGLTPAGMLYCGLRKEIVSGGWHVPLAGLEAIGTSCTRDRLDELSNAAAETAVTAFESIAGGEIAAHPADERKCAWCDYRDICRIETQ